MTANTRNYEEKRNFIRMTLNASAQLKTADGALISVTCIDLSAGGMSIQGNQAVAVGSTIHVSIESPNAQFKSMDANGKVLRCQDIGNGEYEIGVEIETIA